MKEIKTHALLLLIGILLSVGSLHAQTFAPPAGKEIYIPMDLRNNDFTKEESQWSYARMAYTDDVVVFWERPFGRDLSKAPDLNGQNMKVDISNLIERVQTFYDYYKNELGFVKQGSKADRYRMMVMLNYTLEGTAYGGDYDGQIGALWISPNRVQDKKLNCIAHELGHSFQSQIICDGEGDAWGGGGIFEMTSQWMLWQVNPEWTTDENYHWRGFIEQHYQRFLSGDNIYHSPFVLEYWAMKRGRQVIADLFRKGKKSEDPASTYMRTFNLSLDEMSDELMDCYSRLISFDFPRVKDTHQQFTGQLTTRMKPVKKENRQLIFQPEDGLVPETWGFNVINLSALDGIKRADIRLEGTNLDANATYKWRWVLIKNGEVQYGPILTGARMKMRLPSFTEGQCYLVVLGCPKRHYSAYTANPYSQSESVKEAKYPYLLLVEK